MFTYKEENLGDPHFGLTLSVRNFIQILSFFYHKLEWLFQLYIEYWHVEFTEQFQDLYKVGPYSEILKQSGSVPSVGKSGGFVDSG